MHRLSFEFKHACVRACMCVRLSGCAYTQSEGESGREGAEACMEGGREGGREEDIRQKQ